MAMHTGKPSDCWFDALAVRSTLDFFTVAAGDCDDFGLQSTRAHTRTSSPVLGPGLQPQRTVVHMGKPSKFGIRRCAPSGQCSKWSVHTPKHRANAMRVLAPLDATAAQGPNFGSGCRAAGLPADRARLWGAKPLSLCRRQLRVFLTTQSHGQNSSVCGAGV